MTEVLDTVSTFVEAAQEARMNQDIPGMVAALNQAAILAVKTAEDAAVIAELTDYTVSAEFTVHVTSGIHDAFPMTVRVEKRYVAPPA